LATRWVVVVISSLLLRVEGAFAPEVQSQSIGDW
jgi:hypothetical protein